MECEKNRNESFKKYEFLDPVTLVPAGYFYVGDNCVQCYFCRGIVCWWEFESNPEHYLHYPGCIFLKAD